MTQTPDVTSISKIIAKIKEAHAAIELSRARAEELRNALVAFNARIDAEQLRRIEFELDCG